MKKITLYLFLIVPILGYSQLPLSGGPDNFGYTFKNSNHPSGPSYNWFDITTIGTLVPSLADDNFVGPFPISGFTYYGNTPTQFWIGSNGYIAFNAVNIASTAASFPIIPTIGGPNHYIAPFLSDLNLAGSSSNPGRVYRYDSGDTVCVSFVNVPFWYNNANQYSGDNTFQVILNRADSSITFNYEKQVGAPDPVYVNNYVSIGIENSTGNDGLQYYRGDSIASILYTSVKYEYPVTIQPLTDISIEWIDNPGNKARFTTQQNGFIPEAKIKNIGNQNVTSTINLSYLIEDSLNSIVTLGSASIPSLSAGRDTTIVLGPNFSPSAYGRYNLRVYLNGVTNDMIQSNDTSEIFFKVINTNLQSQKLNYSNQPPFVGAISWTGGNGGVACYFEPPYYPARVTSSDYYITALGTPPVGFSSMLFDDGGRITPQGALLDSVYVLPGNVFTGQYNNIPLDTPRVITSGGVYLLWLMGGDGVSLGTSNITPASNQTYEVLFGSWAPYRSAGTQDFLMGLRIEPVITGIENISDESVQQVYPNPSADLITIQLNRTDVDRNAFRLIDIQGKTVDAKFIFNDGVLRVYKGTLPAGIYFLNYKNTNTKLVFTD